MAKESTLKIRSLLMCLLCLFLCSCAEKLMVLKIENDGVKTEMVMPYNKKFEKMMKDSLGIELEVRRHRHKK